jgi:glycosyltransferase involved in cell wall biosynthesis
MKKKLKIWLPTIRAGSGADVFTMRLAKGLERKGHDPHVQWFDHHHELMPWRLSMVRAPAGIDIVHAGSWQGFAFQRSGIPLVITEHQYIAHPSFKPYRSYPQAIYHRLFAERWMRASYSRADAIVAVSEFCAQVMRQDTGRDVDVIHNWVDSTEFAPAQPVGMSSAIRDNSRPFTLLFVGNPSRWKGADLLPELATMLGPGFQIDCLGGLRKSFRAMGLPRNIRLLPQAVPEDMPAIYRSADAVLVPTRYEAFGYVALEAMACGVPVIGFNSAGTAEVCRHGETALLAPLDDLQGLVDFSVQLANDSRLRSMLAQAGRARAVDVFGETRAVDAYLDVYSMALKRRGAHVC